MPRDLETVILKAMARDPAARYQTAAELADDLRQFVADRPIRARRATPAEQAWRWCRRNPVVATLAASVGLLVAVVAVVGVGMSLQLRAALGVAKADRDQADRDRDAALAAERKADHRLWDSLVAQADANRLSRRPGQRFATLDRLREAVALAGRLGLAAADLDRMRNAAVAALALPDLYPGPPWLDPPAEAGGISFDADLAVYARADRDGTVAVRRTADDTELARVPGVRCQLSRDGRLLAVSEPGDRLTVWRLGGPAPVSLLELGNCGSAVFHPAGTRVACLGAGAGFAVFDLADGRRVFNVPPADGVRGNAVAFHPSEPLAAVASYFHPTVRVYDLDAGRAVARFDPNPRMGNGQPAWDPAGRLLAVPGGDEAVVRLFEYGTWKLLRTVPAGGGGSGAAFHPAGDRLVAKSWTAVPVLSDVHTGRPLFSGIPTGGGTGWLWFDRIGDRLAGPVQDGRLGVWRVGAGLEYRTLTRTGAPPPEGYYGAAVHPGGRLLAVGTGNGFALWDLDTGAEAAQFTEAGERLNYLAFDPAGDLLTHGLAGTFRWPVRPDPAAPGRLQVGPPDRLLLRGSGQQVAVSRDGRAVAAASRAVNVEQANAGVWVARADHQYLPL